MTPEKQEENATKLAQLLRTALENLTTPAYSDHLRFFAMELRMRFVALVEQGFSESQALQIVIGRMP